MPDGFIWKPFCPDLGQAIFEPRYTFPKPFRICFQIASFGYLSLQTLIKPFSNPATPSQNYGRFASRWLHLDTFQSIWIKPFPSPHTDIQSKQDCDKHIHTPLDKFWVPSHGALSCGVPSHMHGLLVLAVKHAAYKRVLQSHSRFSSRWLHLDTLLSRSGPCHFRIRIHLICLILVFCARWLHLETFLSRSGSSHFRTQIHLSKAIADLLPDGFIWIPFNRDLEQAIFEPSDPSQSYGRFASRWLHLDIFQSRFGLSHFRAHIRTFKANKTVANISVDHLITSGSQAMGSQAMGPWMRGPKPYAWPAWPSG